MQVEWDTKRAINTTNNTNINTSSSSTTNNANNTNTSSTATAITTTSPTTDTTYSSTAAMSLLQHSYPQLQSEIIFNKTTIPHLKLNIPYQHNGYDCGVYVCKNIEKLLELWPESTQHAINTKFTDVLHAAIFTQEDIDTERVLLRSDLDAVAEKYKVS